MHLNAEMGNTLFSKRPKGLLIMSYIYMKSSYEAYHRPPQCLTLQHFYEDGRLQGLHVQTVRHTQVQELEYSKHTHVAGAALRVCTSQPEMFAWALRTHPVFPS